MGNLQCENTSTCVLYAVHVCQSCKEHKGPDPFKCWNCEKTFNFRDKLESSHRYKEYKKRKEMETADILISYLSSYRQNKSKHLCKSQYVKN